MATQNQGWISARETWRYPKGAERKLKCKRNDSFRAAYELFKAMKLKTKVKGVTMQTTKLSDFLKQQGDTPQGKSTYQAFIDNFDKDYDAESFRKDEKGSIEDAFDKSDLEAQAR